MVPLISLAITHNPVPSTLPLSPILITPKDHKRIIINLNLDI